MTLSVDSSTKFQTIDGFGGAGVFQDPPGYPTSTSNHLYATLGLNIFRSELCTVFTPSIQGWPLIGGTPDGPGDFSVEKQAYDAGCRKFLVSVWINGTDTDGAGPFSWNSGGNNSVLDTGHYDDACTAITDFLSRLLAAGVTNAKLYVSPANEPDITPSYPQTQWSTSQLITFVKSHLGPALATWGAAHSTWQAASGQTAPQIIVAEVSQWSSFATWVAAFEADSIALGYIGYYATHQYAGGSVSAPPGTISRPIWQTECSGQDAFSSNMSNGMTVAGWIHNALTTGNAQAWLWWVMESDNDTTNGGLIGSITTPSILTKRSYVLGNYAKFITPTSQRINATSAPSGVNITAFLRPDKNIVIVCVNTNGTSTALSVSLTSIAVSNFTPWITDANNNLTKHSSIAVSSNTFSATLNATSVTTFISDIATTVSTSFITFSH